MNSPLRVLHLEDSAADTELIQATLDAEGLQAKLTRVESEDDFIGALKDERFDLILADYTLPSFDGLSALRIAQQSASDIPFIFVSGTLGEDIAIEALKTGATDYVLKTRLARLGPAVQRALHEAREKAGRRSAEAALRESEARLEEAQRIAHVGYWERDLETDLLTWSDESYRIFGMQPQERRLDFAALQEFIHPEDRQKIAGEAAELIAGGAHYDVEYRVVRTSGEVRIVHSQGDVVWNEAGRPRRVFGTIQDITDRKHAEEVLQKTQAELAHIARLTTMGELTSSIAHEVNQPLTAIVTSGNACLRWLSNDPPNVDEARELVSRIVKDGHRASDVVRRIREFFKKIAPEKVRLEINHLIKDVIAMVPGELSTNRVQLRTELTADLPPVIGDPIQLQQVLLNLVINSIESMSKVDGPRELLIKSQRYESDSVLVAVQDNGVGFDEQKADQLFEAFYTTKSNGLGLGLSISRTTIEAYGGRLWATTNNGDGATFQFTLPAK